MKVSLQFTIQFKYRNSISVEVSHVCNVIFYNYRDKFEVRYSASIKAFNGAPKQHVNQNKKRSRLLLNPKNNGLGIREEWILRSGIHQIMPVMKQLFTGDTLFNCFLL